jgi:hypothetical protein
MFVSFLMPYIDRGQGPIFHWVMAAQLAKFGVENVAFIGDDRYFSPPLNWGQEQRAFGVSYRHPDRSEWERTKKISLDPAVFDELNRQSRSMLEAFRILLTCDYKPLHASLQEIFKGILAEQPIEAVLSWCNTPSLELAAAEFGLPVIHNELGSFREPHYQGTVYFDFDGVNGRTSAARDMVAFEKEIAGRRDIDLLSLQDLRRLVMVEDIQGSQDPQYKVGAALQVEDDSNMLAFNNGMTNFDLIYAARKGINPDDVLIRPHPRGYLGYGKTLGTIDESDNVLTFISKCDRIVCTNSSVAFEALLLDKPVQIYGDSPVAALSHERLTSVSPDVLLAYLNYIFIGYLAPISILFDAEYYRWRLSRPTLSAIYRRHLELFRLNAGGRDKPKQ